MKISNETPFCHEVQPFPLAGGDTGLLVILKATFRIEGDGLAAAAEQQPILYADEYFNSENPGLVRYESDLIPHKPFGDVILNGTAYPPNRRPAKGISTTLQVGPIEKTLYVFGDRYWMVRGSSVVATEPAPFESMPLGFDRAYGGADEAAQDRSKKNPVGRGFIAGKSAKSVHKAAMPNVEHPKRLIQNWQSQPHPAGYGIIGKGWEPRVGMLGTYDDKWEKERSPLPPEDFSDEFYNSSQPDQQLNGYFAGDEPVSLTNLTPEGKTAFRLPGVRPEVSIQTGESRPAPRSDIDLPLDTLIIEPDDGRVILIWRRLYSLMNADELIDYSVRIWDSSDQF